jgi:3-oxoacyl-[acyl-carrier-protein] synthase-3
MTTLRAVASFLPADRIRLESIQDELRISESQRRLFRRFYGFAEIRRDTGGTPADLLLSAAHQLTELRGQEERVRYVIQARTMPVVAPYAAEPLLEVRRKLGLERATTFALTDHACASGLLAIDLAGRLLAGDGDPDALALVFTGEKTFTHHTKILPDTSINGESAAAFLVAPDGPRDRVLGYATRTHGKFSAYWDQTPELAIDFQAEYLDALAEVMLAAATEAGLRIQDLRLVLPHNVNRVSWMRLCKKIGLPPDRVFLDNLAVLGHCFCADPFLNYVTARQAGRLAPGDNYLMVTAGLGATFAAMAFRH